MKTNQIKAFELIEKGLSAKTVSKLNESQINVLHKKLFVEATEVVTKQKTYTADEVTAMKTKGQSIPGGKAVKINPDNSVTVTMEGEMDEDETDDVTDKNALGADALQQYTGQESPHMANDMAPDGMDDDSDNDRNMMGVSEEKEYKKGEPNPWAICHAQVGPKKTRKFERCVQSVKKQLKEGKNPVSLFIESKIMNIVEKNLPPKITKGDLMKYLSENSPAVKPKPDVKEPKPGTKTPPKPRPAHPGKNPNPGENPAPKAKSKISPDQAKDEVLDLIKKILEN
jgi:hypothetical protein